VTVIAAMTKEGVIGRKNAMPWRIPAESRHFMQTTMGGTVIMGRKTFESMGSRPLFGRRNIIVGRTLSGRAGIDVCESLERALEKAASYGKEVFVAGGAEIYREAIPLADRLCLSYIKEAYEGDTYFPEFDSDAWDVTEEKDHPDFVLRIFQRKRGHGSDGA
jgi:dihydrofolate reductase